MQTFGGQLRYVRGEPVDRETGAYADWGGAGNAGGGRGGSAGGKAPRIGSPNSVNVPSRDRDRGMVEEGDGKGYRRSSEDPWNGTGGGGGGGGTGGGTGGGGGGLLPDTSPCWDTGEALHVPRALGPVQTCELW